MQVPFVDLKSQYQSFKPEMDAAIQNIIDHTAFIGGKAVKDFEEAYRKEYGAPFFQSCANGTDAIYITLKMMGIGAGDEVITQPNTWISTAETISQTGAKPVFVDFEPDYYTLDPAGLEAKITPRTKAIIPVHLYGQPAEMDAIMEIANRHGIPVVEDCAQAHFAEYKGKRVGTFGVAATFSFYPGKNLGAYGDAGGIIIHDADLARKIALYANHGALKKHDHEIEGINSRLDGVQAAVLSVKLPHIHKWNEQRLENAKYYNEVLNGVGDLVLPRIKKHVKHIFHLYVVRTARRDELQDYLSQHGIGVGIHYPVALPFMPAYSYLGHSEADFPIVAKFQHQILSLPMFPELTTDQMDYVAEKIRAFFA